MKEQGNERWKKIVTVKDQKEKIMNNKQMKELYESEPNKWVVYVKFTDDILAKKWEKVGNPFPDGEILGIVESYKLILKEHEHIKEQTLSIKNDNDKEEHKCSDFKITFTDDKFRIKTIEQPYLDGYEFEISIKNIKLSR